MKEKLLILNESLTPRDRGDLHKAIGSDILAYKTMLEYLYGNGKNEEIGKKILLKGNEILAKKNIQSLHVDSIVIVSDAIADTSLHSKVGVIKAINGTKAFIDFFNLPIIKEVPMEYLTRLINLEIDSE